MKCPDVHDQRFFDSLGSLPCSPEVSVQDIDEAVALLKHPMRLDHEGVCPSALREMDRVYSALIPVLVNFLGSDDAWSETKLYGYVKGKAANTKLIQKCRCVIPQTTFVCLLSALCMLTIDPLAEAHSRRENYAFANSVFTDWCIYDGRHDKRERSSDRKSPCSFI